MRTEGGLRYAEAVALAERGRWRAARTGCLAALAEDPDDPLSRSLLLRADAELGRLSLADAEDAARELSKEHPDLRGLRMRAASLRARRGNRLEALREARVILAEDQDDAAAHEFLAGLSCCEDDVTESFLHYNMALDLGGLRRPGSRLTALVQARRLGEPASTSARILADASGLERIALRTASSRAAGRAGLALVVLGWVLAIFGKVLLGAVGVALACALTAWRTFCCQYICWNRQELYRFATFVAGAWIVFGVVLWAGSDMPRVVLLALIALGGAIGEVQEVRKRRRPSSPPVDARST